MSTDQAVRPVVGVTLLLAVALTVQGVAGLRLRAAAATALVVAVVVTTVLGAPTTLPTDGRSR